MLPYQGPNGWYVASEDADGSHRAPEDGGHLTEEQATQLAQMIRCEGCLDLVRALRPGTQMCDRCADEAGIGAPIE